MKSCKEIPIGTILKKGVLGFTGDVNNYEGNLVGGGNIILKIVRESNKEEFLAQFHKAEKIIFESTLKDINTSKFYEIQTD